MTATIQYSVGKNCANEKPDVRIIQGLLNTFDDNTCQQMEDLAVDGLIGNKTIGAIKAFQLSAVGMLEPSGKVEPDDMTFRYLTMYLSLVEFKHFIEPVIQHFKPSFKLPLTRIETSKGLVNQTVTYAASLSKDKQIVSDYTISVIKIALKEAGMTNAVITSTRRSAEEQAKIMYRNAVISLQGQKNLYGPRGDDVLTVFAKNKDKPKKDVISLMAARIGEIEVEYAPPRNRVSKHCVSLESYRAVNVVDIGLNSTRAVNSVFNKGKLTKAFSDLQKAGYIERFIDETHKSNSCWHIEVIPHKKPLANYAKNSVCHPVKFINV